jgi:hypothetical protein
MSKLFLGPIPWIAKSYLGGHYAPPAGVLGWIDLRSYLQCATTDNAGDGFGIFEVPDDLDLGSDYTPFGGLADSISPKQRNLIASALGLKQRPVGGRVADYLYEILTLHTDPKGVDLCQPLMPGIHLAIELVLSGRTLVRKPFTAALPEAANIRAALHNQYRAHREATLAGDMPAQHHLKVLDFWAKQYRLHPDWFIPADLPKEKPVPHETTITDNFNRANSSTLGGPSWTWTEVNGNWEILSNQLHGEESVASQARAESDLSSADHYAQIAVKDTSNGSETLAGAITRFHASDNWTGYVGIWAPSGTTYEIIKVVSGSGTLLFQGGSLFPDGTVVKMASNGSTQTIYKDGVSQATGTDTAITGNLRTGVYSYSTNVNTLDNFQAADLAGITVTDLTDGRVYQRAAGGTSKAVSFAGTYAGISPVTIEVKIVRDGTSTLVQDWTALSSPTISGGNWSGTVTVPQDNYWNNILVRAKDGGGSVLATSPQTSNKWAVGVLVAMLGQSNMSRMGLSDTPPTVNSLTRAYTGSWGNPGGNGNILFSDLLQQSVGCPVGILNYAVGGTTMAAWLDLTPGQPYPLFTTALTAAGGDCEFILWAQGEFDSIVGQGPSSPGEYSGELDTLYSRTRSATGRSTTALKFGCWCLGRNLVGDDPTCQLVRVDQLNWAQNTTGAFFTGCFVDRPLIDDYHWAAPSYEREARLGVQASLKSLGLASYGAKGPVIASASRQSGSANMVLAVTHDGGSALKEADGTTDGNSLTGFQVSLDDFANLLTISSTAFSGNTIVLTLSSAPSDGATVNARYQYGVNPSITNPVYDDTTPGGDSLGLPLQPTQSNVTVTLGGISGTFSVTGGPGSITVTGVSETVNVAGGRGTVTVTGQAGTFNVDNGRGTVTIA